MQIPIHRIVEALGGEKVIKRPIRQEFDLLDVVREGLPMESAAFLQKNLGLTNKTMSHILAISESTYQRRIRANAKLTPDESEKTISLSEVYELGMDVFEDKQDFEEWLESRVTALQNKRPVDFLDSMLGRKQVLNILNAIQHGIFS
ncbi:type II RES/Xre toxin-antitoxin system antitoxin [Tellurirhabdus rosea]|uniref:type II RES/Xre toxin-antitoxin system antitoxin n=1 Tax=Tellurirhabdus rosea TaxID=2674997 RepID=UPI00225B6618|nr:antitoxin Xre-like helix-turn-helix domain-containing protein [Tellurirhabdus rosea]